MKKALAVFLAAIGVNRHLSAEQRQDVANAAFHVTPGAAATGVSKVWGLPLSEWVMVASILLIALQAVYLIWKWRRDYRRDLARRALGKLAEETVRGDL